MKEDAGIKLYNEKTPIHFEIEALEICFEAVLQ